MTLRNSLYPQFDFFLEESSQGLYRLHTNAGALTLFIKNAAVGDMSLPHFLFGIVTDSCFKMQTGPQNHPEHTNWHTSLGETAQPHYHLLKQTDEGSFAPISYQDIECFVLGIKKSEESLGLCLDGKRDCVISDHDADVLLPGFKTISSAEHATALSRMSDKIKYRNLTEKVFYDMGKSYAHAFFMTLIDHYIVPYLITHNYDPFADKRYLVLENFLVHFDFKNGCQCLRRTNLGNAGHSSSFKTW